MSIIEYWQTKEVTTSVITNEKVAEGIAKHATKTYKVYVTTVPVEGGWVVTNRFDPIIVDITKPEILK